MAWPGTGTGPGLAWDPDLARDVTLAWPGTECRPGLGWDLGLAQDRTQAWPGTGLGLAQDSTENQW